MVILLILEDVVQIFDPFSDVSADGEHFFTEVNHCFKTAFRSISDLCDRVSLGSLHELAILIELDLIEHLEDLVIDRLVLKALVLEAFANVNIEVFNADVFCF